MPMKRRDRPLVALSNLILRCTSREYRAALGLCIAAGRRELDRRVAEMDISATGPRALRVVPDEDRAAR